MSEEIIQKSICSECKKEILTRKCPDCGKSGIVYHRCKTQTDGIPFYDGIQFI